MAEMIRLDKFISSQRGDISRSDVKRLCAAGKVTVNGSAKVKSDMKITSDDEVRVDGEKIEYKKFIYIMLNKPQGVVCSTRDGLSPTVLSLIPENMRRSGLFPAGRLDKDTEGFVLITDDGEFAHKILSPKSHVPKRYFVRLERPIGEEYARKFEQGIFLDGEKCLPAQLEKGEDECSCYVTLHQGMYHQIKRMFETLGNKVIYLKRLSIGNIKLREDLPLGGCIEIMHKEIEKIAY